MEYDHAMKKKNNNPTTGKCKAVTKKQWAEVRAAAVAMGSIKMAASAAGVSYIAARKRAERENWLTPRRLDRARAAVDAEAIAQTQVRQIGTNKKRHSVTPVALRETSAAALLEAHMTAESATFRTKAATAISRAAQHASTLDPMLALASVGAIKAVVDAGCKLHCLGSDAVGRGPLVQIACLGASTRGGDDW